MGTAEVESSLVGHEAVAEAAVVGFPHQVPYSVQQLVCERVRIISGQRRGNLLVRDFKRRTIRRRDRG